jgi:glycosyltransferase involved in cell wall biosynthesis
MNYYIVIPAHNEEAFISFFTIFDFSDPFTFKSSCGNDNSTDKTAEIVLAFAKDNPFISLVEKTSSAIHLPGSKVIQAFQKALKL